MSHITNMGQQHVMRACLCWCSINSISRDVTYNVYTGFATATAHCSIHVPEISLLDSSNNEISPAKTHSVRGVGNTKMNG